MDKITADRRSANMRAIRAKDTGPELAVRRTLREIGFPGYRLQRKDLPGKPDVAYIARKKAIFVHGCFWHGHECLEGSRRPKTRSDYWSPKISGNQDRDLKNLAALAERGWGVLVIWECEVNDPSLEKRLRSFVQAEDRSTL